MENNNNLLVLLVFVIVIVALVNLSVTMFKFSQLNEQITGYATEYGYVNLTISSNLIINISRTTINWGSGYINGSGTSNATLISQNTTPYIRQGVGSWSGDNAKSIIIQNLGNVNFTLEAVAIRNATELFGTGTPAEYFWNFTEVTPSACTFSGVTKAAWYNVANKSLVRVCSNFSSGDPYPAIYMDVLLTVPRNTNMTGLNLSDVITFVATST